MTARLDRPATRDGLFLWVMHRFAEVFEKHAVLKGGMALRLIDSPRSTMDIDYVFVPFSSKKDIANRIVDVLREIDGAEVDVDLHSKMLRAAFQVDDAAIQIEVNVARRCETVPMATGGFARSVGHPSEIVQIMSPPHALSHKIAAWNERRLFRDLYDCYFLSARAGASPDLDVLDLRLANVQSQLPRLRRRRSMSRAQLADELRQTVDALSGADLEEELAGLLPPEELAGLAIRVRAAVAELVSILTKS
jgi:predicted nucleotidyltransferase component of viral defense system